MVLAALAVLAGCGPERGAITAGGRIFGDNLTVYTSVPDPATGLGRDMVDASKLAIAQAGGRAGDFGINFVAVDEGSPSHPDPPIVAARGVGAAWHSTRHADRVSAGSGRRQPWVKSVPNH